jgi:REase_AHJR-like
MQTSTLAAETRRVQELAREYRDKGYQVTVEPGPGQLPEPLARFRPDLVARKADDLVVIEVKAREALPDQELQDLAKAVREQPGWRFELVLLKPEPGPPGTRAWSAKDVGMGLRQAEAILNSGFPEAALLLAWSAAEATLRLLAAKERLPLERDDAVYLLRLLVTRAVITREEYSRLWEVLELRNAVAHGLKPPQLDAAKISAFCELVAHLLRQTRPRRARERTARPNEGA